MGLAVSECSTEISGEIAKAYCYPPAATPAGLTNPLNPANPEHPTPSTGVWAYIGQAALGSSRFVTAHDLHGAPSNALQMAPPSRLTIFAQ